MNVRYMPESVLSSLQVLNNVIPMAALKSNYYYFPFSISEETEAQRSCQLAQNYRASESRPSGARAHRTLTLNGT